MSVSRFLKEIGRPVAYYPRLANALGSVKATVLLCQLLYWQDKGHNADGWIYKAQKDIEVETGLNRTGQEEARRHLRRMGLIEEKLKGVPAIMHYRILNDVLDKFWSDWLSGESVLPVSDYERTISIYKSRLHALSKTALRRATQLGCEAELVEYEAIIRRDNGICHICKRQVERGPGQSVGSMQFDHINPLSCGGSHTIDNIKLAHAHCNLSKGCNTEVQQTELHQSSLPESHNLVSESSADKNADAHHTLIKDSETTTENTTRTEIDIGARVDSVLLDYSATVNRKVEGLHFNTLRSWRLLIQNRLQEGWSERKLHEVFIGCSKDNWKERKKFNAIPDLLTKIETMEFMINLANVADEITERNGNGTSNQKPQTYPGKQPVERDFSHYRRSAR